jgi:glutathione S-transferase
LHNAISPSSLFDGTKQQNMSSQNKPIKVWGKGGPNPPKVAMLLEELNQPYEVVNIPFADVKKPEYLAINPNGRIPAIHDPNTDITLWESGAIFEYLIEQYDKDHQFSFPSGTPEYYHAKQWLFFQVSGQGPYFGQAAWFKKFHAEQVPSAIERYVKEINRVSGVLDGHLAKQDGSAGSDGPWLVGNKISYADLAFVSWQTIITSMLSKEEFNPEDFPHLTKWVGNLTSRDAVKKVMATAFQGH